MTIKIRQAQPDDVRFVVPMLYASGPHEFDYVFNAGGKTARDYLSFAFPKRHGGQSHRFCTVAIVDGQVVGISAFYSGRDTLRLSVGNLWSISRFYGLQETFHVIQRGIQMESIIPPPPSDAGFINQLGVKEEFRGHGVGTALVQYLIEQTRRLGLRTCILDVAMTNPRAQALYERLGFRVVQEHPWKYAHVADVPGQRRMELVL